MSKTKNRKNAAVKALNDLRRYLGRDVKGVALLRDVEEYVKDLRQTTSTAKLRADGLQERLKAANTAIGRVSASNDKMAVEIDRFADFARKIFTELKDCKRELASAYEDFCKEENEDRIKNIILRLMKHLPQKSLFAVRHNSGVSILSTVEQKDLREFYKVAIDEASGRNKK